MGPRTNRLTSMPYSGLEPRTFHVAAGYVFNFKLGSWIKANSPQVGPGPEKKWPPSEGLSRESYPVSTRDSLKITKN